MREIIKNITPSIGIGSINVNLPKEVISGKVPAWVIVGIKTSICLGVVALWYRDREKERAEREKDRNARLEIARLNAQNRENHSKNCQKPTDDISAVELESQESGKDIPRWVDAATIEDKKTDSALLGHSGALILVKGREGSGKSTLTIQLLVEACEGKSSNLFPDMAVCGPKWSALLYASEAAPKFKSNFGEKIKELDGRFKAMVNNFKFYDVNNFINHIRDSVMRESGNYVVGIDNITDMFQKISDEKIRCFVRGLKSIRDDMEAQGREITFIVVIHVNRATEEASGSSLWQILFEEVLSIKNEKHMTDSNCKILTIEKSRRGATSSVPIRRNMTKFMHFECSPKDVVETIAVNDKSASDGIASLLPLTEDIDDFFASIYKPNEYGYGRIFKDYKHKYRIRNRDDVRNAIVRSKKRH